MHPSICSNAVRTMGAAALACLAASPALAEQLVLQVGRIGEVAAQEAGPREPPRPGNLAGSAAVHDPRFLKLGSDIDGTFCRQFGMEFKAANLPLGEVAPVLIQLEHPLWTLPNGQSGTTETNVSTASADHWSYTGYTLEEPWSLVSGTWTFTVIQGPRILAKASFNVTVEPDQHLPSAGCDTPTS